MSKKLTSMLHFSSRQYTRKDYDAGNEMYGRIVETRNVSANSIVRFGDRYAAGTYFVSVIQGK